VAKGADMDDDAHESGRSVLCGRREKGKEQLGEINVSAGESDYLSVLTRTQKVGLWGKGLNLVSQYLERASRIGCHNLVRDPIDNCVHAAAVTACQPVTLSC